MERDGKTGGSSIFLLPLEIANFNIKILFAKALSKVY